MSDSWENDLVVVSCKKSLDDVLTNKVYMCKIGENASNFKRALYFGVYADKKVSHLYKIIGVVDIGQKINDKFSYCKKVYNNRLWDDDKLIKEAEDKVNTSKYLEKGDIEKAGWRVFLLDEEKLNPEQLKVEFKKSSSGGMFTRKIYFKNIAKNCVGLEALAKELKLIF